MFKNLQLCRFNSFKNISLFLVQWEIRIGLYLGLVFQLILVFLDVCPIKLTDVTA